MACVVTALLALTPAPVSAQAPAPDTCAAFTWPVAEIKAALAGDLAMVASGAAAPPDFELALVPTEQVPFPLKPERAPKKAGTFGGFVTLDAPRAGLLQVTLSDEAWIDLVQSGALVKSAAFSGKAGCEGVRKVVRFALTGTGPLTLQVSGAEARSVRVDVRAVE